MMGLTEHKLDYDSIPILCLGADTSSRICMAKGRRMVMSGIFSDLGLLEEQVRLRHSLRALTREMGPAQVICCDLHPEFFTVLLARELAEEFGARLLGIQHHKAHVASVASEHGLKDYIGIAMDGLGYGDDGRLWGGEVFSVRDNVDFERAGHIEVMPQIGGDWAAVYPSKMLYGILSMMSAEFRARAEFRRVVGQLFTDEEKIAYDSMLSRSFNVFETSSAGRVLDSASALLGICQKMTSGGEPAILLEKAASVEMEKKINVGLGGQRLTPVIDVAQAKRVLRIGPLFEQLVIMADAKSPGYVADAAGAVHDYLAEGMLGIAKSASEQMSRESRMKDKPPIVFAGGVAFNKIISGKMQKDGVLLNKLFSCGDAGICAGQAYIGNILLSQENKKKRLMT